MMRVLSMWQPWATYCVLKDPLSGQPAKQYETRAWPWPKSIALPCEVAIHATQKIDNSIRQQNVVRSLERRYGAFVHDAGAVIAIATVVEARRTEELVPPSGIADIDIVEYTLGGWEPGRYAFRLENVRPLRVSYHLKGRQAILWPLPANIEAEIRQRL